ncbi:MAG: hypothetical protein PQJ50_06190, partial [Spirochaetales bacterium]|nr:hypothetical protein [Spirochaetales bacterium]
MKKAIIALVFLASRTWAVETINFLSSNADTEQQAVIRYLMDAFELENPGIEVDLIFYNENDLPDDILQTGRNIDPHLIMADSRLLMRLSYRRGLDHSFSCQLMNTLGND